MKTKAQKIKDKIHKLETELLKVQTDCEHLKVEKKHWADLGNYDPVQDGYYTDFTCLICQKMWTEKGSK
jgi:hypothetical protein